MRPLVIFSGPGYYIRMTTAMTIVPPENQLGPAMRALNPRQRAFVYFLVEMGGNATQAAGAAGYGEGSLTPQQKHDACRVRGYQLTHDVKVLAAIKEEAEKRLHSGALLAASALVEMVVDTGSKHRFKAAVELLNRAGLTVATEHKVTVEHKGTATEIGQRIRELITQLGPDLPRLVGPDTVGILDAEFEDVVAPSASGLEDML